MAIYFGCPCGTKLQVSDDLLGKRVRCPKCLLVRDVISSAQPTASLVHHSGVTGPAAAPLQSPPTNKTANGTEKNYRPYRMAIFTLVGLVFVAFVVIAWWFSRNDEGPSPQATMDQKLAAKNPDDPRPESGNNSSNGKQSDLPPLKDRPTLVAQLGHSDDIKGVALSQDSKWLASGGLDGSARIWEAATGRVIRTLSHPEPVFHVAFVSDGKRLVAGCRDGTIWLWDLVSGKSIRSFKVQGQWVNSLAVAPKGDWIITGGMDGSARMWQLTTGNEIPMFENPVVTQHDAVVVTLSSDGKQLVTASKLFGIRLWNTETGEKIRDIVRSQPIGFGPPWRTVALSRDSRWLVTEQMNLIEVATGKQVRRFEGSRGISALAFTADGKWLIGGGADKTVRIWEVATGELLKALRGHTGPIHQMAPSHDGKWLATASADRTMHLWDMASGKRVRVFHGNPPVNAVALSTDGKRLATAGGFGAGQARVGHTAQVWDLTTGRQVSIFKGHHDVVSSVVFSRDGKMLATASHDESARLWDASTGKELRAFGAAEPDKDGRQREGPEGFSSVTLSQDGKWLATGGSRGTYLFDAANGTEVRRFQGAYGARRSNSVHFTSQGDYLIAGGGDQRVWLWDLATGKIVLEFNERLGVNAVALASDGNSLVSGNDDRCARVWRMEPDKSPRDFGRGDQERGTLVRVLRGHDGPVVAVALSPDDKWLVTGTRRISPSEPRFLREEAQTNEIVVRLWDLGNGKELRRFKGHDAAVVSITFTRDGKRLITGSLDGTTRVWDPLTGRELCRLLSLPDDDWAVYDVDGRFDASRKGKIEGLYWTIGNETLPLEKFRDHFHDPGLLAKYLGLNRESLRKIDGATAHEPDWKPAEKKPLSPFPSPGFEEIQNSIGMKLVRLPTGKFMMGLSEEELLPFSKPLFRKEKAEQEEVLVAAPFYIGKFEVTQAEYETLMKPAPAEERRAKLPVFVSWNQAVEFCKKLSLKESKDYTLPTAAQWEYACRAGTTTAYHFGGTISTEQVNFNPWRDVTGSPALNRTGPLEVGSFPPNPWGLYDMHGNASEWCRDAKPNDWYAFRGGSFYEGPESCRSGYGSFASSRDGRGFRVILRIPAKKPEVPTPAPPKL